MLDSKLGVIVFAAMLVGAAIGGGATMVALSGDDASTADGPDQTTPSATDPLSAEPPEVETFDGSDEFRQYISRGQTQQRRWIESGVARATGGQGDAAGNGNGNGAAVRREQPVEDSATLKQQPSQSGPSGERHSSTNVQESGIDEPDVLKTTGDHLYYAVRSDRRLRDDDFRSPFERTHVFDTREPAAPERIAEINASGTLLLSGDRLVVLRGDTLLGYDVSDPEDPSEVWSRPVNGTVETSRLMDGRLYLVTRSSVNADQPCPIEPVGGEGGAIQCSDIYRPSGQIPVDATYTTYAMDPSDGSISDSVSFVGTREQSAIYMSNNALYVTYTERADRADMLINAVLTADTETPGWVDQRLRTVRSYNLTTAAKRTEVQAVLQQWYRGLPAEDRRTVQDRIRSDVETYVREHRRNLTRTGIVKVGVGDRLAVESVGEVPGEPLNQFSMDEHNGTLRIATTIPRQMGTESANDLYVLDADSLDRVSSVQGMGVDERVYAVRYVGETAYVVTFRQIDPFHVVDLSDPSDPEEVGTLELPGYSSYLHPIGDDRVLGIGEEDGEVKTVLFNVSDPSDPTIEDTYYPGAGWSAIANTHHAFLQDKRHGVFFLPANRGGYVVDYTGGNLSLTKRVDTAGRATRAAYIDDYLYVFSDRELTVIDETTWSVVNSTTLWEVSDSEPEETVRQFFRALDAGEFEAAQSLVHPDSPANSEFGDTPEDQRQMMSEIDISVGRIDVVDRSEDSVTVHAELQITFQDDTQTTTGVIELRAVDDGWRIWDMNTD